MRVVQWLRLWLRALFRRKRVEHEMEKELAFHLERERELNVARGMHPDAARRAALVAFGGLDRTREAVRDERLTHLVEQTVGDVRFALRSFRRRPVFAAAATTIIGLSIGAVAAIYALVDSALFRSIPQHGTGQLVAVWQTIPEWRNQPIHEASWDRVAIDRKSVV